MPKQQAPIVDATFDIVPKQLTPIVDAVGECAVDEMLDDSEIQFTDFQECITLAGLVGCYFEANIGSVSSQT